MVQQAAAMVLRRLRCPALEADGRLLLLSLLLLQLPEGGTGSWDWWSVSVERLECMMFVWWKMYNKLGGLERELPFSLQKRSFSTTGFVLCFDGRCDGSALMAVLRACVCQSVSPTQCGLCVE